MPVPPPGRGCASIRGRDSARIGFSGGTGPGSDPRARSLGRVAGARPAYRLIRHMEGLLALRMDGLAPIPVSNHSNRPRRKRAATGSAGLAILPDSPPCAGACPPRSLASGTGNCVPSSPDSRGHDPPRRGPDSRGAAPLRSVRSQAPKRVFRRMSLTIFSAHSPAPLAIGSLLAQWQKCLLSQELRRSRSLWRVTVRKRGSASSRGEARKTDRLPRSE